MDKLWTQSDPRLRSPYCSGRLSRANEGSDHRLPGHGRPIGSRKRPRISKRRPVQGHLKQFGGGGEVIKAMASGAVQIGEVGSAGVSAALSGRAVRALLDSWTRSGMPKRWSPRTDPASTRSPTSRARDCGAVQFDHPFPHHGGAGAGQAESGPRAHPQHGPARSARRLVARRIQAMFIWDPVLPKSKKIAR